jgi:hypothetical protein
MRHRVREDKRRKRKHADETNSGKRCELLEMMSDDDIDPAEFVDPEELPIEVTFRFLG